MVVTSVRLGSAALPAHAGVEGNEHADAVAKRAAAGEEGRAEPEHLGRLVSPISREGPQTPGPWPPAAGSESMSGGSVDPAPHQGEGSARNWAGFERSWQDASTSSCTVTRPRPSTSRELARPSVTDVGGVAAVRGKHVTAFSSGAYGGPPRFDREGCGRESRGTVSGSPQGPPPSASSLEMRAQPRRSWSS